ncbi:MAG: crotonase/enoyl-CoA hydratase family protein [Kofleriaceae bacterium]|jgi:enoyl-CoA hydratase|nr:crotonase/enoyl-CoA hydratase family protein [Kofleriaceae bacterium]MBP9207094.1 crotonase/enoyl-CoA hydratase family protein [Kofleriaceae bacterium]
MADLVSYALANNVAVVTMDDGKANALSMDMIGALLGALDRAEAEAGAMVLAGRDGRFCAGFDLRVMMSGPANATALLGRGSELLLRLYGAAVPLVIACTGHAMAGGALVLLTGDVRVGAAGDFKLGLNEVAIGLPVPVLAMELARDRLLPTELTRATQLAHIYDPAGAARAGYLDEVVAPTEVMERARAEATRLAGLGRFPFRATRERLRGRTINHIRATLDDDLRRLLTPSA